MEPQENNVRVPEFAKHERKAEVRYQRVNLGDFLELSKVRDLVPLEFQLDRMRELPMILGKARDHVRRLSFAKALPCDVCVENFVRDRERRLELGSRIFGESNFSPTDMSKDFLEELYPDFDSEPSEENGRLRVHGITQEGKYQTYCHFCDSDTCLSEIKEGPDWDKTYESQYQNFLPNLPELLGVFLLSASKWEELTHAILNAERVPGEVDVIAPQARGFHFSGSTAWLVNVELLVDEGQLNREYIFFTHEGRKWRVDVSTENDPLVRRIGPSKLYKPMA